MSGPTDQLISRATADWAAATHHCFTAQLADGRLKRAFFDAALAGFGIAS